jgi:hypothetical protein
MSLSNEKGTNYKEASNDMRILRHENDVDRSHNVASNMDMEGQFSTFE